jgi:hypothetical protein
MLDNIEYQRFLASKSASAPASGLSQVPDLFKMVPATKSFQAAIAGWAIRRGCAAVFAGTGLGKTLILLLWAWVVTIATGRRVLVLCPLAVAEQTVAEAIKFGVPGVGYAADQDHVGDLMIIIANYERFHLFDITQFVGIVLDESGIIRSHDGKTRKLLTEACRDVAWKLCCTATPSPNDYTELGQHAEFLGVMDAKEMLAMFFVHDGSIRAGDATQGNDGWRMKRHAVADFWRWLASWSVMVRHPRDLGFDEPGYDLPPLNLHQVTVAAEYKPTAGELFPMQASTLAQRIGVRRDTAKDRVAKAAEIILREPKESWIVWTHLNSEADMIEKLLPDALQVAGRDKSEVKIERLLGFAHGKPLHIVTKGSIAGRGLNWQNCARQIMVGLTDSFEEVYQCIRRSWRFGQTREVDVYFIASELEGNVVANLKRKEIAFELMLDAMSEHMRDLQRENVLGGRNATGYRQAERLMELPSWLI